MTRNVFIVSVMYTMFNIQFLLKIYSFLQTFNEISEFHVRPLKPDLCLQVSYFLFFNSNSGTKYGLLSILSILILLSTLLHRALLTSFLCRQLLTLKALDM